MNTFGTNDNGDRQNAPIRSRAQAFDALGLKPDASPQRIHRRYRRLAFAYHPDRNKSRTGVKLFNRVSQAYRFLKTFNTSNAALHVDDDVEHVCRKCNRVSELHVGLDRNLYCRDCLLSIDGHRGLPSPPVVFASFAFAMATLFGSCATLAAHFVTGHYALAWMAIVLASVSFLSVALTAVAVGLAAQPKRERHRRTFFI